MQAIPVHIISGFLGSGKTTAIVSLLKQKKPEENWAIIINEFGKISIDGQTIKANSPEGKIFEISGGCICCSAKENLRENLDKIVQRKKYNRIIIEPSGLGGAEMISEVIEERHDIQRMPVICLVDIFMLDHSRLRLNLIFRSQVIRADYIILRKTDLLIGETEREEYMNKFIEQFPMKQDSIRELDASIGLPIGTIGECNAGVRFQPITKHDVSDKNYAQEHLSFDGACLIELHKLKACFARFTECLRMKGHINTKDGWFLVNLTTSGFTAEACQTKACNELVLIVEKTDSALMSNFRNELRETFPCLS